MPCQKRLSYTSVGSTLNKRMKTSYSSSGKSSIDLEFFVTEQPIQGMTGREDRDQNKLAYPGFAVGLKFEDCMDINEKDRAKEAACKFKDGFDTMVTVPRIMDVEVEINSNPNDQRVNRGFNVWRDGTTTDDHTYNYDKLSDAKKAVPFLSQGVNVMLPTDAKDKGSVMVTNNRGYPVKDQKRVEGKAGSDYFAILCTKSGFKSFLTELNKISNLATLSTMTKKQWREAIRNARPNPIWSEYYTWMVDGKQSFSKTRSGGQINYEGGDPQGVEDDTYSQWYDNLSTVEMGHYESERYNINDHLCDDIPNDFYADGIIFGIMQPATPRLGALNNLQYKVKIIYERAKVKYGALYLNSLKGVHNLVTALRDIKHETRYRDGNTALDVSNKRTDTIDIYSQGGVEVYGVDMSGLVQKSGEALAGYDDFGVFNASSLFEENDIVPELDGEAVVGSKN